MKFILNLSWREIRSSWIRLLFFFICIAIGVGSIVALRALIGNLSDSVGGDARALLTADFAIDSNTGFSPTDLEKIESVIKQSSIVEASNETLEFSAMAKPANEKIETVQFVTMKGIDDQFPLVGNFVLPEGREFKYTQLDNNGALIAPILLEELGIKIGEKIVVGDTTFTVKDTFVEEPGGSSAFRFGPRVYVKKTALEGNQVSQNRSRIRKRILYRTSSNPTPLVEQLRTALEGTSLRIISYRETQERLGDQFDRTENYLSLTGLLILVLGGVGVWNVARVFVEQKRKAVAVLKCLGAPASKIFAVYILQISFLGFFGSAFGILLAQLGLLLAKSNFNDALPATMSYTIPLSTALQGMLLGMFVSILFSALPLLKVRNIKPNLLLRDENNDELRRLDPVRLLFAFVSIAGLLGLAVWQAGSFMVGLFFLISLAITSLVLYGAAAGVVYVMRKIGSSVGSFSLSQALNSLHRPGNQTKVILLAVGLGAFVVMSVQLIEKNLVREFDFTRNERLPSFFFIDIQGSQIEDFKKVVRKRLGEDAEIIPTVRARISHVNGETLEYDDTKVEQRSGRIGREFAVTYRDNLDESEEIVSGKWFDETDTKLPQVSVLDSIADTLQVSVGDSITFDISGRLVTAMVGNVRKLDVRNTRTAFIFVFEPGVLDNAPKSYAANIIKRTDSLTRQRLQRDVTDGFPNVQVIDVAEIIAVVKSLVENFVLAISFVGSFVILSGILILIGSVSLTKSQRVYENAILKTLGAKKFMLGTILLSEYLILGLLAGVIGAIFAGLLSYAVSIYVLDIEFLFNPLILLTGIFATALLVTVCGVLASFDVLFKKPLQTLRSG